MYGEYLRSPASAQAEKGAVWLVLFLAIGIVQQWSEITRSEEKPVTNIFTRLIKNGSSFIYFHLGPKYSFALAMSPLGKVLFRAITGNKKDITFITKYGFYMRMNTYEYFMSGYFFMGESNPYETKVLRERLKKGDVFMDIGAHFGIYSLNAAQVIGKTGKVIAFEPNPICISAFQENMALNTFTNIILEKIALSDRKGSFDFWTGDDMGGSFIEENTQRLTTNKQLSKIKVETVSLDEYCKRHHIDKINLIKIDVEGAEMQVLQGAKQILSELSPELVIEVIDDTLQKNKSSKSQLLQFLGSLGYKPYAFTAKDLIAYQTEQQQAINLYFSKKNI